MVCAQISPLSAQEITAAPDSISSKDAPLFAIQISAFSKKFNAVDLMLNLQKKGYPTYIVEGKGRKVLLLYKVCMGTYMTEAEAKTEARSFSAREKILCIVVEKDAAALNSDRGEEVRKASSAQKAEIVPALPAVEQKKSHDVGTQLPTSALSQQVSNAREDTAKRAAQDNHTSRTFFEGLPFKIYASVDPKFIYTLYYEDNVAGTINGQPKLRDFSNRYLPSANLSIKSDRLSIDGTTNIEIIEYCRERGYNTVDQDHAVNFTLIAGQRSTVGGGYNYLVNTDPERYFTTDAGGTGAPALVGRYTVKKYKTKTSTYLFTYQYKASPQGTLNSTFMYSNFDTGASKSSDFYNIIMNYMYALSSKTNLTLAVTFNQFDFSFDAAQGGATTFLQDLITGGYYDINFGSAYTMKNYSFTGGFIHMLGNDAKLSFVLGGNYKKNDVTYQTFNPNTGIQSSDKKKTHGDGINYSLKLEKTISNTNLYFNATQGSGTNPDSGASYDMRTINVRVMHSFTKKIQGSANILYNTYEADRGSFGFKIDRKIFILSPSITYNYARWLDIALYYSYVKDRNKIFSLETERNTVYLSLNFKPLRPYIFR
ncbi:MAG: SPOR domain-containing protein [Pseudomonadota bacterium]